MLRSVLRSTLIAGCAGLLAACASTGPLSTASVADYRDSIELTGRISVTYERDGAPQNLPAKFTWVQSPQEVNVALASMLGQTLATIKVTPTAATLTQTDRMPKVAADIDSLTSQALGWPLPVSGLRDWLQGYATDANGGRFIASPANSQITTRDGWKLTFATWQDPSAARPMPKQIDAERGAAGDISGLKIRIVLDPLQ